MAVTLLQAAIDQRVDRMSGSIIKMFDQVSPVFRMAPMRKIDGRYYDYEREELLPAVSWRALNQAWPESTGVTNPQREYLKILGGEAKVDRHLIRTAPRNGMETLQKQVRMKVQAAANEWDRAFFEGSELANVNEMVGLRPRISGDQLILMGSGGATLTLAKLDELIDAVPFGPRKGDLPRRGEGVRKVLFMNRFLRRKIGALMDAATGSRRVELDRNEWGEPIERYGLTELAIIEQTGNGSTTLDFDEDPGDAVADTASIYCVAFGEGLVHGIYNNGGTAENPILIDVQEFGELESEPRHMVRFEGAYGLSIDHPRAAARLYGITET